MTILARAEHMKVTADIRAKVANLVAEVLVVDQDQVTPTAALQRDLGADSLDMLEIMFRLEHEFGIEILPGELFLATVFRINPEWVQDGKLTDLGFAELRARLPYADLSDFQIDRRLKALADLFTVGLVSAFVGWKLDRAAANDEEAYAATGSDPTVEEAVASSRLVDADQGTASGDDLPAQAEEGQIHDGRRSG